MYDTTTGSLSNITITSDSDRPTVTAGCNVAITSAISGVNPVVQQLTGPGCTSVEFNGQSYCALTYNPAANNQINLVTGNWSLVSGQLSR